LEDEQGGGKVTSDTSVTTSWKSGSSRDD
jgi:hypothetical protein